MDISFYALLTVACLVLVLAMWACAAASTSKWGPDMTLELPAHLWQEILFRQTKNTTTKKHHKIRRPAPSAPSELPGDPLLTNEYLPIHCSPATTQPYHPGPKIEGKTKRPAPIAPSKHPGDYLVKQEQRSRTQTSQPLRQVVVHDEGSGVSSHVMSQPGVRVLPSKFIREQKPVFSTFSTYEPA